MITSSPGLRVARSATLMAPAAPQLMTISAAEKGSPVSVARVCATAARVSG